MKAPYYRAPGNKRVGGPFACSGAQGDGVIIPSALWLRYYAPDKNTDHLGRVSLPKALLRLKTGETFWLKCDFNLATKRQNMPVPGYYTKPEEPKKFIGPTVGWFKQFGFWLTYADGMAYPFCKPWGPIPKNWVTKLIRERDECYWGRGADMPPPGNYETQASGCNYITYLFRVMWLGEGKVYVLTGKLPKTPKTRNGESPTQTAEARYWSINHTGDGKYPSLLYGCLMDDEIIVDSDNRYILVYSRKKDRPSNARPEYGITWQDFGPEARQVFNIRWMSVFPDDYLPEYSPHQNNIPWETGEWSSPGYDPAIMSYNNQNGFLKKYQPLVHYMSKEDFEAFGRKIISLQYNKKPVWK